MIRGACRQGCYRQQASEGQFSRRDPNELPGRTPPRSPPHPQGGENKVGDEHDNADDQQEEKAFRDNAHEAQHYRHYHQQKEEGNHPMLRICSAAQRRASRRSPETPGWYVRP